MSTHNIGFYEDLTKIIFELSSNTHLISSAVIISIMAILHQRIQAKLTDVLMEGTNKLVISSKTKTKRYQNGSFSNLILNLPELPLKCYQKSNYKRSILSVTFEYSTINDVRNIN